MNPNETITVELGYMSPLMDDEKQDQIRFTFPRAYVSRYGTLPEGIDAGEELNYEGVPFSMYVDIQQSSPIRQVYGHQTPSLSVSLGRPPNSNLPPDTPDSHFAQVSLSINSKNTNEQNDIVIVVKADKLDNPRAFIERHPDPQRRTAAIGLTLVPRFQPRDSPLGMEFIVLVDRSGSMEGIKLEITQRVLVTLLHGLPSRNTTINIFSFGTSVSQLWPKSQPYNDLTQSQATAHIEYVIRLLVFTSLSCTNAHVL